MWGVSLIDLVGVSLGRTDGDTGFGDFRGLANGLALGLTVGVRRVFGAGSSWPPNWQALTRESIRKAAT